MQSVEVLTAEELTGLMLQSAASKPGRGGRWAQLGTFHEPLTLSNRHFPLPFRRGEDKGEGSVRSPWFIAPMRAEPSVEATSKRGRAAPSPRLRGEGQGVGSCALESTEIAGFRRRGLLSPTLSSRGGEGAPPKTVVVVGGNCARWRRLEQDPHYKPKPLGRSKNRQAAVHHDVVLYPR